jgi:hypothetical protein
MNNKLIRVKGDKEIELKIGDIISIGQIVDIDYEKEIVSFYESNAGWDLYSNQLEDYNIFFV